MSALMILILKCSVVYLHTKKKLQSIEGPLPYHPVKGEKGNKQEQNWYVDQLGPKNCTPSGSDLG